MSLLKDAIDHVKAEALKSADLVIEMYLEEALVTAASDHNFGMPDFTFRVKMEALPDVWDVLCNLKAVFTIEELSKKVGIIITYDGSYDVLVNYSGE